MSELIPSQFPENRPNTCVNNFRSAMLISSEFAIQPLSVCRTFSSKTVNDFVPIPSASNKFFRASIRSSIAEILTVELRIPENVSNASIISSAFAAAYASFGINPARWPT